MTETAQNLEISGPRLEELKTVDVENSQTVGLLKKGSRIAMSASLALATVGVALFFRDGLSSFSSTLGGVTDLVSGWGHFGVIAASTALGYGSMGLRQIAKGMIDKENSAVDNAAKKEQMALFKQAKIEFIAEINQKTDQGLNLDNEEFAVLATFSDEEIENLNDQTAAQIYRIHRDLILDEIKNQGDEANIHINDAELDLHQSTPTVLKQLFKSQRDGLRTHHAAGEKLEKLRREAREKGGKDFATGAAVGYAAGEPGDAATALVILGAIAVGAFTVGGPLMSVISNLTPLPREKTLEAQTTPAFQSAPTSTVAKARFPKPDMVAMA